MRFAFWNTNGNSINQYIASLVMDNRIDTLVLAEYGDDLSELIDQIGFSNCLPAGSGGIMVLTNAGPFDYGPQGDHYSIHIVNRDYILCCMHLSSRLYDLSGMTRGYEIDEILHNVHELKENNRIEDVVFLGDLNDNPYDQNVLEAKRFHALPSMLDLKKGYRRINGINYTKYYNPMWNLFGDKDGPPGTYYYHSSLVAEPFWHMLDQVIISKGLCDRFMIDQLKIIADTSSGPLMDSRKRPIATISDHLPIVFEIGG